ncbi:hypothetical protein NHX12_032415 [Muraenolepis orangiensis]|uniref:Peptidase A2 domain-containing protein n=1 Tax=Muraenolepis orangiensis TaxID=630683 RepID=A0A9Q0E5N1_9TELE|nr:hypothetical protein NHX12_032415 [Muraenolepis orangiensis]
MDCELDGHACRALLDTGSNITLVRPGVLWGTNGVLSVAWTPTAVQMRTVTGERANMVGTKVVHIRMGDQEMMQEVWLAPIQDPCIIGLDLLARWGAQIDVSQARLTIGAETLASKGGLGGATAMRLQPHR